MIWSVVLSDKEASKDHGVQVEIAAVKLSAHLEVWWATGRAPERCVDFSKNRVFVHNGRPVWRPEICRYIMLCASIVSYGGAEKTTRRKERRGLS